LAVADPVRETTARVFQAIAELPNADQGFTTGEIIEIANRDRGFGGNGFDSELFSALSLSSVAGSRDGTISSERLGKWLVRHKNRIAGDVKLIMDISTSRSKWCFVRGTETAVAPDF
jgi:hypothetical protein